MKTKIKCLCMSAVVLSLAVSVLGQTFNTLLNFNGTDGAGPQAGLVASGALLYGTASSGGNSNFGAVFAFNPIAGNLSNVYSFNGAIYNSGTGTYNPADGANPVGTLVLSSNMLYGTTSSGGSANFGTVFAVNTNGGSDVILHSFTGGGGGADPEAGLVLVGNTLFGTTFIGGSAGEGTIFRVNTDGSSFTNIYSFTGGTNGSNPEAGLILAGTNLYGTTYGPYYGGSGYGTVFKINMDGSGLSNVYTFNGGSGGAFPAAGLLLAGSTLYGTASAGGDYPGASGDGTVFSVNTNGNNFHGYLMNYGVGSNPAAGLLLLGNTLYGTATNGGAQGYGAIFQITTNGTGLANLYSFLDGGDGASPEAPLALWGNTLYGTTEADDAYGLGTIFGLTLASLRPSLNISLTGNQVTLTWSNPAFALQTNAALNTPFATVSGAASPFTTNATNKQLYFRLNLP